MNKLKDTRIANNMSQSQVADYLKITRQGYNHYETGRRSPDANTLKELSALYDVSVDYLLGNDNNVAISSTGEMLSEEEEKILTLFNTLTKEDKVTATGYIEFLTQNEKYKKSDTPHIKDEHDFDNAIDRTSALEKTRNEV